MGKLIRLGHALESDPAPMKAPPAWANTEVGTINGRVVLHAGGGRLDGKWHRQDSDEFLMVVRGSPGWLPAALGRGRRDEALRVSDAGVPYGQAQGEDV